jgi:capsular polysaccharide transport system permease protein
MNMHGIMRPGGRTTEAYKPGRWERIRGWGWKHRVFCAIVLLPSFLLAAYLFLFASDQYESEAHFLVKSANTVTTPGTGISQALSMVSGSSIASTESAGVADYLASHDVVDALRQQDQLVARFHRPDIDLISRLRQADPTPEQLLKYFRRHVDVSVSTETGIATLTVHSFTPQDSYVLAERMLELGERRINLLNRRSYNDAVASARKQLAQSEQLLTNIQKRMTAFRQTRGDIDPQASGQAQLGLVTTLSGDLAAARAQLAAMGSMIDHGSPQYRALSSRVRALEMQVASQSGRLTGSNQAIAADIGGYEGLKIRQQLLAKNYEAAAASLDRAKDQALRQQLYLVRIVEPNKPGKALFPRRWNILGTTVIALLLIYSIGWLIVAGVREHAA